MVWMSGTDKLCYYFNKGWLDFVGRTLEQESGNGGPRTFIPMTSIAAYKFMSKLRPRQSFEMEYRMRHHNGQYR